MGHRSLFPAQGFHQRAELALRVADQDFIIGVIGMEHEEGDQLFHPKGFPRAGDAQVKSRLVQQVRLVAQDGVMRDCVIPQVNAALVLDFLQMCIRDRPRSVRRLCYKTCEDCVLPIIFLYS